MKITVYNSVVDDTPKLKHLNRHVRDQLCAVCAGNPQAWKDLGRELIPGGDEAVRAIAANNPHDLTSCCASIFDKWLERDPKASWRQLIEALNEIKLNKLATDIKKKLESSMASQVPKGMSLEIPIESLCTINSRLLLQHLASSQSTKINNGPESSSHT